MMHRYIRSDFSPDRQAMLRGIKARVARAIERGATPDELLYMDAAANVLDEALAEFGGHRREAEQFASTTEAGKRRARLLRFLESLGNPFHRYDVRIGPCRQPFDVLTTDALEDLAARAADDFWAEKRRMRLNRAAIAAMRASVQEAAE